MQQRSEETHLRILEAANQLFSQLGYDAAGVAEICAQAGVSKGAFYHHFPTKQSLFIALLEQWLSRLDLALQQVHLEAATIPQAIGQMANMAGGIFQKADVRMSIFLEFYRQAQRDPAVWEAAIAPYRRYLEYFVRLVQEGIHQGSLNPVNPELGARVLISLAMGLLLQALFDPRAANWEQETGQSFQLLLLGLARREL